MRSRSLTARASYTARETREHLLDARTGRAMLAEFGIARIEDAAATAVTMTGVAVGTPSYMTGSHCGDWATFWTVS